eukprot:1461559-Pleurochrysis_carterae.AAC.1
MCSLERRTLERATAPNLLEHSLRVACEKLAQPHSACDAQGNDVTARADRSRCWQHWKLMANANGS